MCEDCGCGDPEVVPVEVQRRILAGNDAVAAHNREHFAAHGVLAVNLMGGPGSGKTALLEATARSGSGLRLAAVSGDLATDHDGDRLRRAGIPAKTITTGTACHLDARLVQESLHDFDTGGADVFVIENVGNLVCPAVYDLGQALNVVTLSVTEGEDKPLKYPSMFRIADLVVLTKVDLLPALPDFRLDAFHDALGRVHPRPHVLALSSRTGENLGRWIAWLRRRHPAQGLARAQEHAAKHGHGHGHDHDHDHVHERGHSHAHPHTHPRAGRP